MIDHVHKCIFIHMPFTGGTSIEHWLMGKDYWYINKEEKHLTANQAKEKYREYWDSYFKFSLVRHPYTRCVSALKDAQYGVFENNGYLDLSTYLKMYGFPMIVEHDHRFVSLSELSTNGMNEYSVYSNFIGDEIDKIYRFEEGHINIQKDLAKKLDIKNIRPIKKLMSSSYKPKISDYSEVDIVYAYDFDKFGYKKSPNFFKNNNQ